MSTSPFGLQTQDIALTPAGYIRSQFLTGADSSNIVPLWSIGQQLPQTLAALVVGQAISIDLSQYLTDPGSPTSQLGFRVVSGQDPISAGFAISGTPPTLTNACLLPTSGIFQLVAVRNEVSVLSPSIAYAITTAVGTDTVPPTIPTIESVAPGSAVGTISLVFDPPCDMAPNGVAPAGSVHVDCYVNGAKASPPSPIVVPANAINSPTLLNLGGQTSPTLPLFNQNNTAWTFSAAGTGIAATASEQALLADFSTFTGAWRFVARLNPYNGGAATTALMGIMFHETGAVGGRFFSIGLRPQDGTVGLFIIGRATASTASTQIASLINDSNGAPITGPVYVRVERASDLKTMTVYYSETGTGWTLIGTYTLTMNAAVHMAGFMTSQDAGVSVTGVIDEIAISNTPMLTTTINATANVNIQLAAVDADTNVSALSPIIVGKPKQAVTGAGVKFHPGFYAYFNNNSYSGSISHVTSFLARGDIQNITGIQVYLRPGEMEPTKGNYTQLFGFIDNLIALCSARGKRLSFGIWDRGFGNSDGTSGGCAPAPYMLGGTHTACPVPSGVTPTPAGSNAYTVWAASCANFGGVNSLLNYGNATLLADLIAMYQALGDRYNNNPWVECFIWFGETALSPSGPCPTQAQWTNAIQTILSAIAPHWQNTLLRLETNFVPGGSLGNAPMTTYLGYYDQYPNYIAGGPDPINGVGFTTTSYTYFSGKGGDGKPNRTGANPLWSEVQVNGLGGSNKLFPGGTGSGATLGRTTADAMIAAQASAGAWYFTVDAADETDTVEFTRDMLPAINAVGGQLRTGLPSAGNWNTD